MGANTNIEWTDHTWNPWIGCTKVSPGCAHCYAEARDIRFNDGKHWGKGAPRQRTTPGNWREPYRWNRAWTDHVRDARDRCPMGLGDPAKHIPRPRVFCASLADWLDDEVPTGWRTDLIDLIRQTQNLDWLLLTKRPQNWRPLLEAAFEHAAKTKNEPLAAYIALWLSGGAAPTNVWIGTTAEDQERADERIPILLSIPARVRFLSCEPLLGPVDLLLDGECSSWACRHCGSRNVDTEVEVGPGDVSTYHCHACGYTGGGEDADWRSDIHWVICGGESGAGARPMHPDWARSLRDQCQAAGVAYFFKQWGEYRPSTEEESRIYLNEKKPKHLPPVHVFTNPGLDTLDTCVSHVGKKSAGRLLDGREWDELPEVLT